MPQRRRTSTSNFGVGRRESHDASGFYRRFRPPQLDEDGTVLPPSPIVEPFICGDSRSMDAIDDGSVALVVTSPPYFAGKEYEEELERDGVPGSYLEYLQLLREVFAECVRKLEPGGRVAVNVANLGRKPYRSLSADVIAILQDDLGLLMRGEIIWQKGEGASGSCAWGSFASAANPVLRDLTERVVVASKGRFDRAVPAKHREERGLPFENTLTADDFMSLTLDVWSIPPESAKRVGHPAPFPVELPEQLIRLYTYAGDLVLDPFMGSGSSLVAAARLGRRYAGYDLDPAYVEIAERRVKEALAQGPHVRAPITELASSDTAGALAEAALVKSGFVIEYRNKRIRGTGVAVPLVAADQAGGSWFFEIGGPNTSRRAGLTRAETVWRTLGRAAALRGRLSSDERVVVLTTCLPEGPGGDAALRSAGPAVVFDVIDVLSTEGLDRLSRYATGRCEGPLTGFWRDADLRSQ
jgi:DNA modification methylase